MAYRKQILWNFNITIPIDLSEAEAAIWLDGSQEGIDLLASVMNQAKGTLEMYLIDPSNYPDVFDEQQFYEVDIEE